MTWTPSHDLRTQTSCRKQCAPLCQDLTFPSVSVGLMTPASQRGESGDSRAEIQHGCSLCGLWGGSFFGASWAQQHQQPRGSSASRCAGVDARYRSQSACLILEVAFYSRHLGLKAERTKISRVCKKKKKQGKNVEFNILNLKCSNGFETFTDILVLKLFFLIVLMQI